ncbi:MAG: hypothetical protein M4D80_12760 [Myxococcota bacterium]|nr:hypothetical protein [Myxococcota bacterium]
MHHDVYLSPGMFGFGRLGSYNYFAHVERELTARFAAAGQSLVAHVIEDLPTASIRRRATRLAETVATTASPSGVIHLLGHSTGGLDARIVASPATHAIDDASLAWLPRLRSVTTMNTPHFGTPLASFFATSNGQRALAALSMLTVAGLAIGARPLAAAGVLVGCLHGSGRLLALELRLLDRTVESVAGLIEDACSPSVREFLTAIQEDQGAMLQLSPESMDLVGAGIGDRPGVVYRCTASMAPSPTPRRWLATFGHPWQAVSHSLFYALHRITADPDDRYQCTALRDALPWAGDASETAMTSMLQCSPSIDANDGCVPLRSQLWGELAWAGLGDHLDVLGHYQDDREPEDLPPELRHVDWLKSGSDFGHGNFAKLMDAIAAGMLAST